MFTLNKTEYLNLKHSSRVPQEKTFSKKQKYAGSKASLTETDSFMMNPIQNYNIQKQVGKGRDSFKVHLRVST